MVAVLPRVLLVDDEVPNLDTFRRVFRGAFQVSTVASATEALDQLEKFEFDVVVVDYSMPMMNGVDLLATIAPRYPRLGRIMLTAHADLGEVRQAKEKGLVMTVISKPYEKDLVVQAVNSVCRLQSMRQAVSSLREQLPPATR